METQPIQKFDLGGIHPHSAALSLDILRRTIGDDSKWRVPRRHAIRLIEQRPPGSLVFAGYLARGFDRDPRSVEVFRNQALRSAAKTPET